jgi:membrane fusion protein (multidrug efflux system)
VKISLHVEHWNPRRATHALGALLLGAGAGLGCESTEPEPKRLPEVVVADVAQQDVPIYADWIGTVEGFNNATIRPQVKGYLLKIDYDQGSVVEAGKLLFEIDSREFKAELDSAKGQLGEATANLAKSKTHVVRYKPLAEEGAVSQQELDDAVQNMLAAEAGVLSAQARVEKARLNLGWTKITSPIAGVAGIAKAQIGDLVGPESHLTTVSQLDPIKVNFPVSEKAYLEVVRRRGGGASGGGKLASAGPILQLYLADGSKWPDRGTPFVLGRSVDEQTGTILIEGRFPNPNNVLRPGQFARVRVDVGTRKNALLVPQRALSDVQGKYMLSVVSAEDIVEIRSVEVGETVGENWIVTKGIEAGERVVVEGIQKIRSGMKVRPVSEQTFEKKDKTAHAPPKRSRASMGRFLPGSTDSLMS